MTHHLTDLTPTIPPIDLTPLVPVLKRLAIIAERAQENDAARSRDRDEIERRRVALEERRFDAEMTQRRVELETAEAARDEALARKETAQAIAARIQGGDPVEVTGYDYDGRPLWKTS